MAEYNQGAWGAPLAITSATFPYYAYPALSDNGKRLISLGPNASTGSGAVVMMETAQGIFPYRAYLSMTFK